jgi:mono/diheme cytochrome c family protein
MRSLLLVLGFVPAAVSAQAQGESRGELLYNTHCIACHTKQVHWREQRLARDWGTLKFQVRHFQEVAYLGWTEDDVDAVARFLNDTIYRFPDTQTRR